MDRTKLAMGVGELRSSLWEPNPGSAALPSGPLAVGRGKEAPGPPTTHKKMEFTHMFGAFVFRFSETLRYFEGPGMHVCLLSL